MILDALRPLVSLAPDELETRWKAYIDGGGPEDLDLFLRWLREKRAVTTDTFHSVARDDLHVLGDDVDVDVAIVDHGLEILGTVGKGAMGKVLVARQPGLHRKVAVKRLHAEKHDDPQLRARFLREVQITAQLEHPGIVPVYFLEEDEAGRSSCVMKLVRGQTLKRYVAECASARAQGRPLVGADDLRGRLDSFLRICDAVAFAHDRGIVHRDLKPSNIMIGPFGEVYVMDWGLARPIRKRDANDKMVAAQPDAPTAQEAMLTVAGAALGTPQYMSPEQAMGQAELDERSDLYSLALVLYEIIALRPAITGETDGMVLSRALRGEKDPPPPMDADLAAILAKAGEPHVGYRYASVGEMAADVRRYLGGEPVEARPMTGLRAMRRWIHTNAEWVVGACAAATLGSVAVAAWTIGRLGG